MLKLLHLQQLMSISRARLLIGARALIGGGGTRNTNVFRLALHQVLPYNNASDIESIKQCVATAPVKPHTGCSSGCKAVPQGHCYLFVTKFTK